jgi:hypothetical protein
MIADGRAGDAGSLRTPPGIYWPGKLGGGTLSAYRILIGSVFILLLAGLCLAMQTQAASCEHVWHSSFFSAFVGSLGI